MKPIQKLYYSISEVSEMTGLKAHVLRYWESEFDELSPKKNRAGNRIYTEADIQTVLRLQNLLRKEKFTIEGARQKLAGTSETVDSDRFRRELLDLRAFLKDINERLR